MSRRKQKRGSWWPVIAVVVVVAAVWVWHARRTGGVRISADRGVRGAPALPAGERVARTCHGAGGVAEWLPTTRNVEWKM